jgi:hypothetical protein
LFHQKWRRAMMVDTRPAHYVGNKKNVESSRSNKPYRCLWSVAVLPITTAQGYQSSYGVIHHIGRYREVDHNMS